MEGRWTLDIATDHAHIIGVRPGHGEPLDIPGIRSVPVVPCDDAAVERAALALHLARGLPRATFGAEDYCGCREHTEAVLRAARETP